MKKVFFYAAMAALMLASCGNKTQANASASDSDSVATEQTSAADGSQAVDAALTANLSPENKAAVEQLTSNLQKAIASKDSKAAATTLAQLHTKYQQLVEQGNLDEAKAYGSAIQAFVNKNSESLKTLSSGNTTVVDLVNGIANLPTSANTTIEEAKAALSSDGAAAKAAAELAKGAAETAVKDAANQAVNNAKTTAENAASKAVNDAKAAAASKVNSEVSKVASSAAAAKAKADAQAAAAKAKADAAKAKADAAKQKATDALNNAANTKLKDLIK